MKVRLAGLPEEAPAVVTVTVDDVEAVVSNWTGIPVQRMTQDDRERLTRMEPALKVPPVPTPAWPTGCLKTTLHQDRVHRRQTPQ